MNTFGLVVGRLNDNQTYLGLPDIRGSYHQVQLNNEQLEELAVKILEHIKDRREEGLRLAINQMIMDGEIRQLPDGTLELVKEID